MGDHLTQVTGTVIWCRAFSAPVAVATFKAWIGAGGAVAAAPARGRQWPWIGQSKSATAFRVIVMSPAW